jgi:hypothetical protein
MGIQLSDSQKEELWAHNKIIKLIKNQNSILKAEGQEPFLTLGFLPRI